LRATRCVSYYAAGDRYTEILAPKLLAGGGVERLEVAADIAEVGGRFDKVVDD